MTPCCYCGSHILHTGECPRVSAREYFPNGTLRRVEFHAESDRYVPIGTTRVMTETGWRDVPAALPPVRDLLSTWWAQMNRAPRG